MSLLLEHRRFTVDEYHRMAEAGILDEDERVELLDGEVVAMSPIGRRHAACVDRLTHWLTATLGNRAIVRVQNPIALDAHSEPEPDLALLRPRDDFYATRTPGPADITLVIEVADTTIDKDRKVKLPLYARHGIVEVWLIDLIKDAVEVHRSPSPDGYADVQRLTGDQSVTCLAHAELNFAADALLGR